MGFGSIFSGSSLNHGDGSNSNAPTNGGSVHLETTNAHYHASQAQVVKVRNGYGAETSFVGDHAHRQAQAFCDANPGYYIV
jgi:hypothetical protein